MRNLFDYMNSGSGSIVASEIIAKVEDTIDEVIAEIKEPIEYEKREYEKRNYDSYYDANEKEEWVKPKKTKTKTTVA